jgi:hypothetical protein
MNYLPMEHRLNADASYGVIQFMTHQKDGIEMGSFRALRRRSDGAFPEAKAFGKVSARGCRGFSRNQAVRIQALLLISILLVFQSPRSLLLRALK